MKRLFLGIDLQEGFLNDDIRGRAYVARVEKFLKQLIRDQVVLTRFVNVPGNNFDKLLDYQKMQADDPDTKLFGNLETSGFMTLDKDSYTAWHEPVVSRAKEIGAEQIVLFGLDFDVCVFKTALDVFDAGLDFRILTDLCDSSNGSESFDRAYKKLELLVGASQLVVSDSL